MRCAPPVQASASASGSWRIAQCFLWSVAAGSLVAWSASWWVGVGSTGTFLGTAAAVLGWTLLGNVKAALPRTLIWDGTTWSATVPGHGAVQGQALLMIDLGTWLLVRFDASTRTQPQGIQPVWMPLYRRDNGGVWHGLRSALYAPVAQVASNGTPHATPANE